MIYSKGYKQPLYYIYVQLVLIHVTLYQSHYFQFQLDMTRHYLGLPTYNII